MGAVRIVCAIAASGLAEKERRDTEERVRREAVRVAEQRRKAKDDSWRSVEWAEADNGADFNWSQATRYCASRGSGWRLLTTAELQSCFRSGQSTLRGSWDGTEWTPAMRRSAENLLSLRY